MKRFVFILIGVLFLGFVLSAEVSINPSLVEKNVSQTFSVDVLINAPVGGSDFYAIEFDTNYNSSVIVLDSVSEGNLSASGVSNYEVISNSFHGYYFLNSSGGIYGSGSVFVFNFRTVGAGISDITLDNLIWVNSTITNDSAVTISPILYEGFVNVTSVLNGTVNVTSCGDGTCNGDETCSTCSADCGACPSEPPPADVGSGGGGGGGGGGGIVRTPAVNNSGNSTQENYSGGVDFGLEEGETAEAGGESSDLGEDTGTNRPSITGRIIGGLLGEGGIFKSWAFWFVVALVIVGAVLFFLKFGRKKISKY